MNNKGFSLIELLAVIAIIGIIAAIATISYNSFIKTSKDKVFENYMDSMHEGIIMLYSKNPSLIPTSTKRVSLSELELEAINNPMDLDDKCLSSYIDVTRNDLNGVINLHYNVCLVCNNYHKCKEYTN